MPSISAALTLVQLKLVDGSTFAVRSTVTAATPAVLAAPLVITAGPSAEMFLRVATLDELTTAVFTLNPILSFGDSSGDITASVTIGDTLRVLTPPRLWDDAAPAYMDFVVDTVASPRITVTAAVPFPMLATSLSWQLRDASGTVYNSGTAGNTSRLAVLDEFIDSEFTAVFTDQVTALQHLDSLESYINTLVLSAGSDADNFRNAPPGNPVITTFPTSAS